MFDQPALEVLLRQAMQAEALATLQEGVELVGIAADPADSGVTVQLRDPDGTVRAVHAQAVLGCDGANSAVRGMVGACLEDLRFEERWLVIDVHSPAPLDTWPGVYQVCDPARAATYMQVGPGRYRWEFRLHDGETPESVLADPGLEALVRPWLGELPFGQLEVIRQAEYTFKARIVDSWRQGRVFLLGDAAHLTPPFIGQGLCAGLRDAANLTWKLAAVLEGRAAESLLDSYQTERAPHARALVLKARTVGWVMTGGQDAAAHVRRLALAVVCRIPGADRKVLDTAPPRFQDGPAVHRVGRRDRVTGSLVPQPFLLVGSDRLRLDEVTGPGYSVLIDGEPDPALIAACQRVGATLVQVVEPGSRWVETHPWVAAVDGDGALLQWLRAARTQAVLVRPDHVVQSREPGAGGGPLAGAGLATQITRWADEVGWRLRGQPDDVAAAS
jgi:3-(3-hydroxy-phenyl)propionate hydroxylase